MAKKLLSTAIIGIDYDEPDTETYRGVYAKAGLLEKTFSEKGITEDFRDAFEFTKELAVTVMMSSSVDHYIMDGPYVYTDGTIRRLENEP